LEINSRKAEFAGNLDDPLSFAEGQVVVVTIVLALGLDCLLFPWPLASLDDFPETALQQISNGIR